MTLKATDIENGKNRLFFSQRYMITEEAEKWCDKNGVSRNPFNIVTALSALGYLDVEKVRNQYHQKTIVKYGDYIDLIERDIEKEMDEEF